MSEARELRHRMRAARRVHADRTIWRELEDGYVWVFAVVVVSAMAVGGARGLRLQGAGCRSYRCMILLDRLPLLLLLLLLATALRMLLAVGPVVASRATGFWLLRSPVDQAALLRPAYLAVLVLMPVVALGIGLIAMATPDLWSMRSVLFAAVLVALLLVGLAGAAVLGQLTERRTKWIRRIADATLVVVAVLVLAVARHVQDQDGTQGAIVIISRFSGPEPAIDPAVVRASAVLLAVAVVVTVLVTAAGRSLRRLPVARVVAGGDLVAGLAGAAASLDVGLLADIVAGRRWRTVPSVRNWAGRWSGPLAIVQREASRVLRWPRRLLVGAALLIVPYSVDPVGNPELVLVAATVAGLFAVRPLLDGLRTVSRSPGLTRALPLSPRALRISYAVVPGMFTAGWSLAAAPALITVGDDGTLTGLALPVVLAAGVLAASVRHASAPRPSYDGPLLATPMGAIPPGLMSQPLRGLDVLVVAVAPSLFGWPPAVATAIAVAVLALVLAVRPARTPGT